MIRAIDNTIIPSYSFNLHILTVPPLQLFAWSQRPPPTAQPTDSPRVPESDLRNTATQHAAVGTSGSIEFLRRRVPAVFRRRPDARLRFYHFFFSECRLTDSISLTIATTHFFTAA